MNTNRVLGYAEITYRGVKLVRHNQLGPRGGRVSLYQAASASRTWSYWYDTARQAAAESNSSDRVVAFGI